MLVQAKLSLSKAVLAVAAWLAEFGYGFIEFYFLGGFFVLSSG